MADFKVITPKRDIARELARKYSTMTHDELDVVEDILEPIKYGKGEMILPEGEQCMGISYIEKGLVRQFYFKNGKEVTEHLGVDHTIFMCIESLFKEEPTRLQVEALEPTLVYMLPKKKLEAAAMRNVNIQMLYRKILEESLIQSQIHADLMRFESAPNKYKRLCEMNRTGALSLFGCFCKHLLHIRFGEIPQRQDEFGQYLLRQVGQHRALVGLGILGGQHTGQPLAVHLYPRIVAGGDECTVQLGGLVCQQAQQLGGGDCIFCGKGLHGKALLLQNAQCSGGIAAAVQTQQDLILLFKSIESIHAVSPYSKGSGLTPAVFFALLHGHPVAALVFGVACVALQPVVGDLMLFALGQQRGP